MKDNKKNVCLFNFSKVEINSESQLGPSIIGFPIVCCTNGNQYILNKPILPFYPQSNSPTMKIILEQMRN